MIEDLKNLVEAITVWPTLLAAILFFSLAPGVVLRLAVLLYPPGHPRRAELVAELEVVPRWQRPFWVAEAVPAPLFEGIPQRLAARKSKKTARDLPVETLISIVESALTKTEREILMLEGEIRTPEEARAHLGMSAWTFRLQRQKALVKLGTAVDLHTQLHADDA